MVQHSNPVNPISKPDSVDQASDSDSDIGGDLFAEPSDFYQPQKPPTFVEFSLNTSQTINLRLVGHNPLWGHHLWNSGRVLAQYFQEHPHFVADKDVLELGAGAGLPGLVAGVLAARRVVITDYPDEDLVANLKWNVKKNESLFAHPGTVSAEGYLWGAPPPATFDSTSTSTVSSPTTTNSSATGSIPQNPTFDLLILADLLFNHSEHAKLIRSIQLTLRKTPQSVALVFFTPYRPWLLEKDLAFFDLAKEAGFEVKKTYETVMPEVMFQEDRGDELLRRTVFGYEIRWGTAVGGEQAI